MSQKFREVKRKANVGERIKIVNPKCAVGYGLGDEGAVIETTRSGVLANFHGGRDGVWHNEYVVLEPIEDEELSELFAQFIRDNAGTVRKFLDSIENSEESATTIEVEKPEPNPLTRAEVIAKAKADAVELERIGADVTARLPEYSRFSSNFYRVEFHVNRSKRAVTALIKSIADGEIQAKAVAKASPDDVFNADIGKAIALRRALGLTVPDKYINAPQPDEPRVGAVVQAFIDDGTKLDPVIVRKTTRKENGILLLYRSTLSSIHVPFEPHKTGDYITDDTDVNYEEVA